MSDHATEAVLQFENIRIGFGEGDVLRGVSFAVEQGETLVLVGETGTGKTLLLKMAAGLLKPDSGRVRVLGREVSAMREDQLLDFRRQFGVVFQEGALFDSLTVRENVAFRLMEEGVESEEIEARVREALQFVEMEHAIEKLPGDLSGGMRRRVSIARALISRPPIVLYDSPTAGLDPVTAQTIITLILRLRDTAGVTGLLATHRLQDAYGLANYRFDAAQGRVAAPDVHSRNGQAPTRILVLRDGAVYFLGGPDELMAAQDQYLKKFLV